MILQASGSHPFSLFRLLISQGSIFFVIMQALLQKLLFSASLVALAAQGAPYSEHRAVAAQGNGPKAVYFLTNNAQNAVVALPVGCDGTLSRGSVSVTGGNGANSINMNTKLPAAPDALISQSALTVSGQVRELSDLCMSIL